MKKFTAIVVTLGLSVALAACSGGNGEKGADTSKQAPQSSDQGTAKTDKGSDTPKQNDQSGATAVEKPVDDNKVVATINGKDIKGNDYNSIYMQIATQYQQIGQDISGADIQKQLKQQALDSVIGQELLLQDVDQKNYKATDEDVKKQVADLKKQLGDDKAYQSFLDNNKITEAELKDQIIQKIKLDQYIAGEVGKIKVSDQEIQDSYDQYVAQVPKDQKKPKLSDLKPQLEQQITQQKQQQQLIKIVDDLKGKSDIKIKI